MPRPESQVGVVKHSGLPADGHVLHTGVAPGDVAACTVLAELGSLTPFLFARVPQVSAIDGADCLVHGVSRESH